MIRYSVVIPQRDAGQQVARQLPRLTAVLQRLALPYEVVIVDDSSSLETQRGLQELLAAYPALRVLRLDTAAGASPALSAGIAAARGEIVIALEPGERYPVEQIPQLVGRLSRLDLVGVRRRLQGWRKLRHRLARIPRALLLGLEVRQPERLFWAARREALAGIRLEPGMRRYLPWMVARRGFRVGDIYIDEIADGHSTVGGPDARPNPLDLLTAWWNCRRWRDDQAREIQAGEPPHAQPVRLYVMPSIRTGAAAVPHASPTNTTTTAKVA